MAQMQAEGVTFHYGAHVGVNVPAEELLDGLRRAWCSPAAPRRPRDLPIPGRELEGIHFAMDFLPQQNRRVERRAAGRRASRSWPPASTWS